MFFRLKKHKIIYTYIRNMDIDIEKMYKYQIENIDIGKIFNNEINELKNKEYEKYLKYLNFFLSIGQKKDKYNKEFLNNKYILIDRSDSQKKIIITPTEFINIHKLYFELKNYSDFYLEKIISLIETKNNINDEDRKQFNLYKEKYIQYRNQLQNINSINKDFYDEMEILLNKKIEKSFEYSKYYQKRLFHYNNIKMMIPEKLKYKLIKYFKENKKKIPSLMIINKIAKENNVPSDEIEKWFLWIENVYFYRLLENELFKINKEIEDKEQKYDMNTKYMIIKKPSIIE